MNELFLKASRGKYRFTTVKGSVSLEDMWDIPLLSKDQFNLDRIAQIHCEYVIGMEKERSFVSMKAENPNLEEFRNKFELIKHVIEVKMIERAKAETESLKRDKKDRILSLIKDKKDAEFSSKSIEELENELDNL